MRTRLAILLAVVVVGGAVAVLNRPRKFVVPESFPPPAQVASDSPQAPAAVETATFGAGCFWCTEAVFARLRGVQSVTSGYSGGRVPNPTYEQICGGDTGHAEVVQLTFDPAVITYPELLEVFWRTHDPTTPNRQGHDVGTQYRSVVFTHNDSQRDLAETYRRKIDEARVYDAPIVTEITPFTKFYPAENYHQNYFALNGRQPYCRMVIQPKVEQLERVFRSKLKSSPN